MTNIKNRTINPENWIDEEVTFSVKNNILNIFDEAFYITETKMPDNTTIYSIETIGITAFDFNGVYEASDEGGICSREDSNPIDAIVKVLANIY